MNRIFGTSASKKPKPTLQDAIASVSSIEVCWCMNLLLMSEQTDARIGSIEVKVKKLDGELARYKEQMSKLRNGPGKVIILCSRLVQLIWFIFRLGCHPTAGPPNTEAKTDVWRATEPACSAEFQHGICSTHHRQFAEHNGHSGCNEDGQQGDA